MIHCGENLPNMLKHNFLHCDISGMLGADSSRNAAQQWWRWCSLSKVKMSTARQRAGKGSRLGKKWEISTSSSGLRAVEDYRRAWETGEIKDQNELSWWPPQIVFESKQGMNSGLWRGFQKDLCPKIWEWVRMKRILHFCYKPGPKRGRKHS